METPNEAKHTPEESVKPFRERIILAARDYCDRQGISYPMLPAYIQMVKAQIREAFYCGFELFEKDNSELLEENERLKGELEACEKHCSIKGEELARQAERVKELENERDLNPWPKVAGEKEREIKQLSEHCKLLEGLLRQSIDFPVGRELYNEIKAALEGKE